MGTWDQYAWPVPRFAGVNPVVSNPFRRPDHLGVDIMYPRDAPGEPELPWQTKRFEAFPGVPIMAAGPGNIHTVLPGVEGAKHKGGKTSVVIVDHHRVPGYGPLATMYLHLAIEPSLKPRQTVTRNTRLGLMSYQGTDTAHLHFAMSTDVTDRWGVDPKPFLKQWPYAFEAEPMKTPPSDWGWLLLLGLAIVLTHKHRG